MLLKNIIPNPCRNYKKSRWSLTKGIFLKCRLFDLRPAKLEWKGSKQNPFRPPSPRVFRNQEPGLPQPLRKAEQRGTNAPPQYNSAPGRQS